MDTPVATLTVEEVPRLTCTCGLAVALKTLQISTVEPHSKTCGTFSAMRSESMISNPEDTAPATSPTTAADAISREAAAQACLDEFVDAESSQEESDFAYNRACEDCADTIRSLPAIQSTSTRMPGDERLRSQAENLIYNAYESGSSPADVQRLLMENIFTALRAAYRSGISTPTAIGDDYFAFCREVYHGQYEDSGADIITIEVCSSDDKGAFKVYRAPVPHDDLLTGQH